MIRDHERHRVALSAATPRGRRGVRRVNIFRRGNVARSIAASQRRAQSTRRAARISPREIGRPPGQAMRRPRARPPADQRPPRIERDSTRPRATSGRRHGGRKLQDDRRPQSQSGHLHGANQIASSSSSTRWPSTSASAERITRWRRRGRASSTHVVRHGIVPAAERGQRPGALHQRDARPRRGPQVELRPIPRLPHQGIDVLHQLRIHQHLARGPRGFDNLRRAGHGLQLLQPAGRGPPARCACARTRASSSADG